VVDGLRMLAPAERFADKHNIENPELYAVFPYRRIAIGRPGIELGIEALSGAKTAAILAGGRTIFLWLTWA
jgi:hypothetical protein